ncbi:nucleotide exchange factor GrpE [Nocardioides campestrisoli]|uniref:nucleotide exchange factor GrpE n=1 Tax=Nocardioides campestrisoli TaxID=2736757 RepID=UPI001CD614D7|nr:nucleotide exchange factor GrpE [Nocardioides campestrisoli]
MTQPSDEQKRDERQEAAGQVDGSGAGVPSEEGAPAGAGPEGAEESPFDAVDAVDSDDTVDDGSKAAEEAAALTADLQRLQAEFLNYKRRVERDRQLIAENAAYKALVPIIDVLDGIDRAREAGEVEGGFAMVADHLQRAVSQSGLVRFGEPGDAFDPNLHEALSHLGEDAEVDRTTVKLLAKAGYRMGERVVRAAQVLVVDPPAGGAAPAAETPADDAAGSDQPDA